MVTQQQIPVEIKESIDDAIDYPDSDGKPMADNTKQFRWIMVIEQNLDRLFSDDPTVFVAGDLLWYPVEGNNKLRTAPDAMVVFGRPKGDRGSYQQWREDNVPPQVVFEILSPGNTKREMTRKLLFYNTYGVEEYYVYDPDRNELAGWCRSIDGLLDEIEEMSGWLSPRLGIRFELGEELQLYQPNGEPFLSFTEVSQQRDQERQRAEQERQRAEQEQQRAEQERQRAEQAEQQTEQERQRAEQAEQQAEQERQRAEQAEQRAAEMAALLQQYRDRLGE